MATDTTVPLTVSDEAATRIAELGMQREFEQMIQHTRETVPGLKRMDVFMNWGPCGNDPRVIIDAYRSDPDLEDDTTDRDWGTWQVALFPPQVCEHFTLLSSYEVLQHGR